MLALRATNEILLLRQAKKLFAKDIKYEAKILTKYVIRVSNTCVKNMTYKAVIQYEFEYEVIYKNAK